MNNREKLFRSVFVCLLFLILCVDAAAETVWGDLDARYANIPRIEYAGETWTLKNRITSILVLGAAKEVDKDETAQMKMELAYIVVIDDDAKTITPIEIENTVPIHMTGRKTLLRDVTAASDIFEMDDEELLDGINALLPDEGLVEHYFILNLDDLEAYDGEGAAMDDRQDVLKQRVKNFIVYAEGLSTHDQADLLAQLSESIASDLKSGAIVKIADKAERYEIMSTVHISGEHTVDQNGQEWTVVDEQKLLEVVILTFFEKQ